MGWIEPKDMLPPKGLSVLLEVSGRGLDDHGVHVTYDHEFVIGAWVWPRGEDERVWLLDTRGEVWGLEIHAWMPLPKHFAKQEVFEDWGDMMEHSIFEDNPEWLYQGDNVYEQMTLDEFLGGANEKEQGAMQEM
jgi:hypothetical protein